MKLIFAGAGASKATNPEKYPTTVDFYLKLPEHVKNNHAFVAIDNYLKNMQNREVIDVEMILWTANDLVREADEFGKGKTLLSSYLSNAPVGKFWGKA